jgi:hypothetical protein
MTKVYRNPDIIFGVDGKEADIYKIQRLPLSTHLVINNKYEGVKVIDPWQNGAEMLNISFSKNYLSRGSIDGWCFRSDGKAILVMDEQNNYSASLLFLESGEKYDLAYPPFKHLQDLRYCWEKDSFWLTGGHSSDVYKLEWQKGIPTFVESTSIKARAEQRDWKQALGKILTYTSNVYTLHTDLGQIVYQSKVNGENRIGMVNWKDGSEWSAPAPEYAPVAAYHNKKMFYILDRECYQINDKCEIEASYPLMLPHPYEYRGLEILPASETTPAALVLMANSSDKDGLHSRFLIYKLED